MNPKMERVNSSESSHRDARGLADRHSLISAIEKSKDEYQEAIIRKREIETLLGELNSKVKGAILPQGIYRDICDKQNKLKNEKLAVEIRLVELKKSISRLLQDKKLLDGSDHNNDWSGIRQCLELILKELRLLRKEIKENGND